MRTKKSILLPKQQSILTVLGENISLAIRRRKLSMNQVAERANMCRETLSAIRKGDPGVSMGNYILVLFVLGLDNDISKVANDDMMGHKIQDANLPLRIRASKRK